jgi:hypothetical protein
MLNRQRRIEFTVGIEGTADIEWPRRLDQVVESDPEPTLASSKCRNAAAPVSPCYRWDGSDRRLACTA